MTKRALTGLVTGLMLVACRGGGDTGVPPADTDDPTVSSEDAGTSDGETEEDTDEPPSDPDDGYDYLTPTEHLKRISMALRGTRPAPADIERVEEDPDAIEEIVWEYMQGSAFAEVIRYLHNDAFVVETNYPVIPDGPLANVSAVELIRSVGQQPLRLAQHIVMEDRPYSELVTADYWIIDEYLSEIYGLPYDQGGPRWQKIDLPGPRPAAGILSDNTFFLRHESAGANYNRGRANAVSRALLCQDFLSIEVNTNGDVDLSDPDDVANAVQTNPACVACHESLDPIASHFFAYPGQVNAMALQELGYPLPDFWQPQGVDAWMGTTGREPAYFGEPTGGLAGLGKMIAEDPDFSECAARRFYAFFHQTRLEDAPNDEVDALHETFVDSGLDAKTLIAEIVLSDSFRRVAALEEGMADDVQGYLKARPFQLALLMEDLTGFAWDIHIELEDPGAGVGSANVMRDPRLGLAVLAGGIDSDSILQPALTVNATTVLALQELAREAGSFAVEHDRGADSPRLLTAVDPGERDEDAIRAQLVELMQRIYAETHASDDEDIDLLWAVFNGALGDGANVEHAWKATLTAMLSDISIIYY